MRPRELSDGAQTLTAAGVITPSPIGAALTDDVYNEEEPPELIDAAHPFGLDLSSLSGDYRFAVDVSELKSATGTPGARVVFEDSVDAFTAAVPAAVFTFAGPITAGVTVSCRGLGARLGTADAVLRSRVAKLDGGTPSITLRTTLWN